MNHLLNQQLKKIELQEQKILNPTEPSLMESALSPMMNKIQGFIPDKLKNTLDAAFYKGFQIVFEKGSTYIEKTYQRDKITLEYDINNYAIDKRMNKKHINKLDRYSKQTQLLNSSFSVLEGGVLGVLGIGLPDIPLFLAVLVKTLYEIALSYGYSYDTPEERAYILLLISGAITKGEVQREYNHVLELLGRQLDSDIESGIDLDLQMKETSTHLSEALLTAKFIQGIPVVGVIGGAVNYSIVSRAAKYARLKYKKRYLLKKAAD